MKTNPATRRGATIQTQLLSSSQPPGATYTVLLTAAGSGYSQWRELAITRWRGDASCDDDGSYLLLRESGDTPWSATAQPLAGPVDHDAATFSESRACFTRRRGAITAMTQVLALPEGTGEVRKLTLRNDGEYARDIEVTSYAELVLAGAAGDAAHPAFSKLFVQTAFDPDSQSLLATRRRRGRDETECWAAHLLTVDGNALGDLQWESDRARFIGRDRSVHDPLALEARTPLSGSVGTVLDPVFALRQTVRIQAGQAATLTFWTVVSGSRESVLQLAHQCRGADAFDNASRDADADATQLLQGMEMDPGQVQTCQRLASALLYLADPSLRPTAAQRLEGVGGAPNLWPCGISGDHPILLASMTSDEGLPLAGDVLKAHAYLIARHVHVDLVILNRAAGSTADALQPALQALAKPFLPTDDAKPAVFVLRQDALPAATRAALLTSARVHVQESNGNLAAQLDVGASAPMPITGLSRRSSEDGSEACHADKRSSLEFDNGIGGFSEDGRTFVTVLHDGMTTPMPWSNVIANPHFGFLATASGSGYTWLGNSQKNTLTPWGNDSIGDAPVEVVYVRDEDNGALWTPTALPIRDRGDYTIHHGKGYSRFQHCVDGIEAELLQFVAPGDAVKISRLRLYNRSDRERHLSVTAYVQWQLGANGADTTPYVVTERDAATGALLARNPWREDFAAHVAFFDLRGKQASLTADRTGFIGRNGSLSAPAALQSNAPLSGCVGEAVDPCGALQARLTIAPGAAADVIVLLGEGSDTADAQALIAKYRLADPDVVLQAAKQSWDELLDVVQVQTPDRAFDVMLNHWLLYQVTACRLWARTAFYQASGAFGFRDQLQDVMALCVARGGLAREHILLAASRQFTEGDVQHWWLPPSGAGIRTRMTDDRLWLPYVACHYLTVNGDTAVLDVDVPFLQGAVLQPGQLDSYFRPDVASASGTLYEHCARAIDVSLQLGTHGLPLVGTGDWNDGMNRVGEQGRGESSWLGWFLIATIEAFLPLAQARGDSRMRRWRETATKVRAALEDGGWDGAWYRRGYYDDGTPLGSSESRQCRIDAIAQSWSVMAKANDSAHAAQAMAAVEQQLICKEERLALLFTPPFDHPDEDPGYIAAYPPGIRENGGQYTHGGIWSIFAFAMQGEGDKACALFELINPLRHADNPQALERYKVEPYVACADVYSVDPHVGRGGWTWYTGSAAWLYRAGLEAILGFRLQGDRLLVDPCIPRAWPVFTLRYRHGASRYVIQVRNPDGVQSGICEATIDGEPLPASPCSIPLQNDGKDHHVTIVMGAATAPAAARGACAVGTPRDVRPAKH